MKQELALLCLLGVLGLTPGCDSGEEKAKAQPSRSFDAQGGEEANPQTAGKLSPPEPNTSFDDKIAWIIRALEATSHKTLFEIGFLPSYAKREKLFGRFEQTVSDFGRRGGATALLAALKKAVDDLEPKRVSEEFRYFADPEFPRTLGFIRVDGDWFLLPHIPEDISAHLGLPDHGERQRWLDSIKNK